MSEKERRAAVARALISSQVEQQDRLHAPYERALGKLAIRFSLLHAVLEQFGWRVWGMEPQVGALITSDLPTSLLVKKLRDTTKFVKRTEEDRKEFLAILTRVEKVAQQRNEYLHSIWILKEGQPVSCVTRKRGRLVGPNAPSSKDIEDLNRRIMNIVFDFLEFRDDTSLTGLFRLGAESGQKK